MTPQEAVGFIEESAMLRIMGPIGEKAWQTLKSAVLAQQTNNTGSLQCSVCSSHNVNVIHVCEKCGSEIDVSNWRDRAQQAGA